MTIYLVLFFSEHIFWRIWIQEQISLRKTTCKSLSQKSATAGDSTEPNLKSHTPTFRELALRALHGELRKVPALGRTFNTIYKRYTIYRIFELSENVFRCVSSVGGASRKVELAAKVAQTTAIAENKQPDACGNYHSQVDKKKKFLGLDGPAGLSS